MADITRAMQTPPPASEQTRTPAGPDPRFMPPPSPSGAGEKAGITRASNIARDAKNERDRLRRKAKRAADAKAAKLATAKKAAAPKRKKKKAADPYGATTVQASRKRRRGRPPGAKNKPKVGLAVALVPAPGVRGRNVAIEADAFGALNVAMNALYALPVTKRTDVLTMLNRLFG